MIKPSPLIWDFNASPSFASIQIENGNYKTSLLMDPFPGFAHNTNLTEEILNFCIAAFPLYNQNNDFIEPVIYLPVYEGMSRTNGCCYNGDTYREIQEKPGSYVYLWATTSIVLYGKRLPIHPSMTRYLVTHEYGHAVERAIADHLKMDRTEFLQKYAEIRSLKYIEAAKNGTDWVNATQEIFANDFRVLICQMETEFWPHSGAASYPSSNRELKDWWREQTRQFLHFKKTKAVGV